MGEQEAQKLRAACNDLIDWALDQNHGRQRAYWLDALNSIRTEIELERDAEAEQEQLEAAKAG